MNRFKLTSFFIFCVVFFLVTGTMQLIHSHHTPGDGSTPHPDVTLSNEARRECGLGSAKVKVSLESVSLGDPGYKYEGLAWADSGGSNPKMGEDGNGVKLYMRLVEGTVGIQINLTFLPGVNSIEFAGVSHQSPNTEIGGSIKIERKEVLISRDKKTSVSDRDWWPDPCNTEVPEKAYASGIFSGHDSSDLGSCTATYTPEGWYFIAYGSAYCSGNKDGSN